MRSRFFLYFDDEGPARQAEFALDGRQFEVRVLAPDEHVSQWAVHALKNLPGGAASPRFRLIEYRLGRLARRLGDEYDGNEIEVPR